MTTINFVDNFKLRTIIEQSITSFKFLQSVKPQDDISSELAGFEISKLLHSQQQNQHKFAELVLKRANLTQITQKRELEIVEAQIANLSVILKQSTKKLCKLFKQNPDLERDSLKVRGERRMLIARLDELMQNIKTGQTSKFMLTIAHELDSQDQMRRLLEKEKNLNIEIKKLQQDKQAESRQYQKQIAQNQSRIQEFKETLMQRMEANKIELEYKQKEASAELSNLRRILQQKQKTSRSQLQELRTTLATQRLVHAEMQQYLKGKNEELKKKIDSLLSKTQSARQNLEGEISKLKQKQAQIRVELDLYKARYQEQQQRKIAREKAQRDKIAEKRRKEEQLIRLDNAIKYIQNEYLAWKEAGGGKKKKKKK